MVNKFIAFLLAILIFPSNVFASDPTPLFVIFFEIPILVLSCLALLICFFSHKVGGVLLGLHLIGSFFVLAWASEFGYMWSAGNYLRLSFVVDIVSVVVLLKKLNKTKKLKPNEKIKRKRLVGRLRSWLTQSYGERKITSDIEPFVENLHLAIVNKDFSFSDSQLESIEQQCQNEIVSGWVFAYKVYRLPFEDRHGVLKANIHNPNPCIREQVCDIVGGEFIVELREFLVELFDDQESFVAEAAKYNHDEMF